MSKTRMPRRPAERRTEKQIEAAYVTADNAICARVEAACRAAAHAEVYVIYAAYPVDTDGVPIDNLDKVAVRGRVMVGRKRAREGNNYTSPVLLDPTWLQLCVYANASIETMEDAHHVFFEGLDAGKTVQGIKVRRLVMGS